MNRADGFGEVDSRIGFRHQSIQGCIAIAVALSKSTGLPIHAQPVLRVRIVLDPALASHLRVGLGILGQRRIHSGIYRVNSHRTVEHCHKISGKELEARMILGITGVGDLQVTEFGAINLLAIGSAEAGSDEAATAALVSVAGTPGLSGCAPGTPGGIQRVVGLPIPFKTSRTQPARSIACENALRTSLLSNGLRALLNAKLVVIAAV